MMTMIVMITAFDDLERHGRTDINIQIYTRIIIIINIKYEMNSSNAGGGASCLTFRPFSLDMTKKISHIGRYSGR